MISLIVFKIDITAQVDAPNNKYCIATNALANIAYDNFFFRIKLNSDYG